MTNKEMAGRHKEECQSLRKTQVDFLKQNAESTKKALGLNKKEQS